MKNLIIADTHLSHNFNPSFYRAIVPLIKQARRVIINGDFWDEYLTTFDQFINSEWKRLFPLLKAKQSVYVFGNHDPKQATDHRANFFSVQQVEALQFRSGKVLISCTHGHQVAPEFEARHPLLSGFLRPIYPLVNSSEAWLGPIGEFRRNYRKKSEQILWSQMKQSVNRLKGKAQVAIVGHVHSQFKDKSKQLYSVGTSRFGVIRYVLIKQGKITQHESHY